MSAETVRVNVSLSKRLHRRAKQHAERQGQTLQQYYLQAIRDRCDFLDEYQADVSSEVVPADPPSEVEPTHSLEERIQRLEAAVFPPPSEVEVTGEQQSELDSWEINGAEPVAPPDPVQVRGLDDESVEVAS